MARNNKPQKQHKPGAADDCFTPGYAVEPILFLLKSYNLIWEPAVGGGLLANALEHFGYSVARSGYASSLAENNENFLAGYRHPFIERNNTVQVTNPPYSLKVDWIRQSLANGMPWALLLQDDTLSLKGVQKIFKPLRVKPGIVWFSPRVNFKMPNKGWKGNGAQFGTVWITWNMGFSGNIYNPMEHWTAAYRRGWEAWHEGETSAPPEPPRSVFIHPDAL